MLLQSNQGSLIWARLPSVCHLPATNMLVNSIPCPSATSHLRWRKAASTIIVRSKNMELSPIQLLTEKLVNLQVRKTRERALVFQELPWTKCLWRILSISKRKIRTIQLLPATKAGKSSLNKDYSTLCGPRWSGMARKKRIFRPVILIDRKNCQAPDLMLTRKLWAQNTSAVNSSRMHNRNSPRHTTGGVLLPNTKSPHLLTTTNPSLLSSITCPPWCQRTPLQNSV